MSDLHTALAAVQADLPAIGKDHLADMEKFSYTYASLNDVNRKLLPVLAANGLTWTCTGVADPRGLVGTLTHAESGETSESWWPLPGTTDPQQLGSAVTYARRYLLLAMVGSAPDEDDDGAAAQGADDRVPTVAVLRTRIGALGEGVFGALEDWLSVRGADKVADLDEDGRVALDVQLAAWEADR